MIGDDEYGTCEHGKVVHYRYPCRRCFGTWRWLAYVAAMHGRELRVQLTEAI